MSSISIRQRGPSSRLSGPENRHEQGGNGERTVQHDEHRGSGAGVRDRHCWAEAKITVSREESKPQKVEVTVGEEVRWINATGGIAHIEFAGANGIRFYIGKEGHVKFDKPGTYDYTVHISGVKAHAHTGTVLVK